MAFNNSTLFNRTTTPKSVDWHNIGYAVVGGSGMLVNAYICSVFLINRKLLRRSALIFGVTCSHFISALAIGAIGMYRWVFSDIQTESASTMWCVSLLFPVMYPLAFQSMGLLLILVGIERLLALSAPTWFHGHWTNKCGWRLAIAVLIVVSGSLAFGIYTAWYRPPLGKSCTHQGLFGKPYILYSGIISVVGGTVAVSMTIIALFCGSRRLKKVSLGVSEMARYKKQFKLTRPMLCLALFDFCFIVIPNAIVSLSLMGVSITGSSGVSTDTNIVYCANSVLTIIPYMGFNSQFRNAALGCMRKHASIITSIKTVKISPMAPSTRG